MEIKLDVRNVMVGVILAVLGFFGGYYVEKVSTQDTCVAKVQSIGGPPFVQDYICKGVPLPAQFQE